MYYAHEAEERKPSVHPMNTELPPQSTDVGHGIKAFDYMDARRLSAPLAINNGWYVSAQAGDTNPRIVIPCVTHKVGHAYWQARDVSGKAFLRYTSPKGPRHEALVKVAPMHSARGIVVVEGPMDALSAAQAGYLSYAIMGMQPNRSTLMHLCLLIEDNSKLPVLVVLDRDSKANGAKICLFIASQGYRCAFTTLPGPEKDLAECLPIKRKKFLSQSFQSLFK
jgi:hypothetical protein